MPREDAQTLAKEKAQVMYEYLEQFLNEHRKVSGHLDIMSITNRLVANLLVTEEGAPLFEQDYDLKLPSVYADFLTEELSKLVLEKFMPSDYYGVSEFFSTRDLGPKNRDGFDVFNGNGSQIEVNLYAKGERYVQIMREHNKQITAFRDKQKTR